MSRPKKQGVDYFPVDVNFDNKTKMLIAEHGAIAIGVLIVIWQMIYADEGYFINAGDDLNLLIRREVMLDLDTIKKIIESCIQRDIFDKTLEKEYNILTSRAVQKRYFQIISKRKRVCVHEKYLLVEVESCDNIQFLDGLFRQNDDINGVSSVKNPSKTIVSSDINPQSKVKESKVKEKGKEKGKESTVKNKKNTQIFSPEAFTFSKKFYEYMAKNGGKLTPSKSDIEKGADTIDKLIRIDKYDLEKEIKPAIFWGLKTPPWAGNIISLANLRSISKNGDKKFNNLFGNWSARNKHEMTKQEQLEVKSFQNAKIATKMVQERYGENE
jgi:hypothetical protein